ENLFDVRCRHSNGIAQARCIRQPANVSDSGANTGPWLTLRNRPRANRPWSERARSLSHQAPASHRSWSRRRKRAPLLVAKLATTSDTSRSTAPAVSGVRLFPCCECKCPARRRARSGCTNVARENREQALRYALKG